MITYKVALAVDCEYHYVYLDGEKVGFIIKDYNNCDRCYYWEHLVETEEPKYEAETLEEMKEILEN